MTAPVASPVARPTPASVLALAAAAEAPGRRRQVAPAPLQLPSQFAGAAGNAAAGEVVTAPVKVATTAITAPSVSPAPAPAAAAAVEASRRRRQASQQRQRPSAMSSSFRRVPRSPHGVAAGKVAQAEAVGVARAVVHLPAKSSRPRRLVKTFPQAGERAAESAKVSLSLQMRSFPGPTLSPRLRNSPPVLTSSIRPRPRNIRRAQMLAGGGR